MKIEIEKVVYKGLGMGRLNGKVYFVPHTLPHEVVDIEVEKEAKNYGFGRLKRIITPSPYRRDPPCLFYKRCGGCHLMHSLYSHQIEIKRNIIREMLGRDDIIIRKNINEFGNRFKMELSVRQQKGLRLGYFMPGTHTVVEITDCPAVPLSKKYINLIKKSLMKSEVLPYNEKKKRGNLKYITLRFSTINPPLITLVTLRDFINKKFLKRLERIKFKGIVHNVNSLHTSRILGERWRLIKGTPYQEENVNGVKFRFSFSSFFQTNPYMAEMMVRDVKDNVEGSIVWDLYAGVGLFSLSLDETFEVTAVESNPSSLNDLRYNAEILGRRINILEGKVEDVIQKMEKVHTVILDPPRKGLDEKVVKKLNEIYPEKLIYISCNPPVFIRDMKRLESYNLEKIYMYDMFPQTYHIELMGIFRKL